MVRTITGLLLLLSLAGCLSAEGPEPDGPPSSTSGTTTGKDPGKTPGTEGPDVTGNATYPVQAFWTECESAGTSIVLPFNPDGFPRPPGWERASTDPLYRVMMQVFYCDRVSWGPFERPVRMLFESHNSFEVPRSCFTPTDVTIQFEYLATLWVDDTEVAAYLQETYGINAVYSDIQINVEDLPLGHEYTVSFGAETQPSWFSVTDDTGHVNGFRTNFQYFWHNDTVLGALDFFIFPSNDQTGDNPAVGKMYAPTLMSQINEDYASIGMWFPTTRVDGDRIALYQDLACEEPV